MDYQHKPLPVGSDWRTLDVDVLRWHLDSEGLPLRPLYVFVWNRKNTDCSVVQWLPSGEVRTALTCPPSAISLENKT